ncbi:MAG: histidinol-phosphate transaminase [Pseudomonadota bacterium]|nr:histidinol-phosphate transaminase [Pseudomonadota bacterium]
MNRSADERAASVVRPEIFALSAYAVANPGELVKLDAMENPYGLPQAMRDRIAAAVRDVPINRYPDGHAEPVQRALRRACGIGDDLAILLGNGSDELIQIITCALARPGAVMAAPEPSFVMYRTNALHAGMRFVGVELREDFSLDATAWQQVLARDKPALVFMAYPNNPTANLFSREAVEAIITQAPGLVVIDEAYHAFAGATFIEDIGRFPNLVVLRTLSKLGMAGLRLGYAVGSPAWISQFDKLRPPYNINALTQAVVSVLLGDPDVFDAQARSLCAERTRVIREVRSMPGLTVYDSSANFIVVRVPNAPQCFEGLKSAGILVKNLHGYHPRVQHCLRVTIGTTQENDLFLGALRKLT